MTSQFTKGSLFMVASGDLKNGVPTPTSFVKSQVDSLQSAGWEVFLGIVDNRTSVRGIKRNLRRLKVEVAQARPALVHAQYGSVTAAIANSVKGDLPLVVSFCGDDILGTPNPHIVWRVRERCARFIGLWAARRAAAIIVKSNNLFEALPASLRSKATVRPNGVNTDWFRPTDRDFCRNRLGWSTRSKVVLFNISKGTNQNVKKFPLARLTVDTLSSVLPDVSLQVVADASQETVRLMLNAADCLLLTSLHEGSPNIVKEAMSCNLPVVSVPCGDVAERLRMTRPGYVCTYDVEALVEAIQEVFKAGCRSNGREQLVAQGLTTTKVAERLSQVYHKVLEQNLFGAKEVCRPVCVE